ncbi:MAG: hypothetical protein QW768_06755 [Thermoproteota archaeon]
MINGIMRMPELELLVAMLGSLITIFASIGSLAYWLGRKFTQIDARLEALEKKIDERFEVAEKRTNERFEALEKKIDERFEVTEERTNERFNTIERKTGNIVEATRNQLEFFTEFLGFRKVIEQRDVTFVRGELSRLSSISNPLTKEESKRLKELLDKDKLTLQEADELREIARKLVREYGDKVGETWKLLMYASLMRGIALSELEEQEKQENK